MTNRTRTGVAVAAASVGVIANTVATLATAFSFACQLRCGGGELYRRLRVSVQRQTRGEPEIACRSARAGYARHVQVGRRPHVGRQPAVDKHFGMRLRLGNVVHVILASRNFPCHCGLSASRRIKACELPDWHGERNADRAYADERGGVQGAV